MAVEWTQLGLLANPPTRLLQYVNIFGSANDNVLGTIGWGRDSRDSAIYTTEGMVQRASLEVALPVFDIRYYKLSYQHQWFHPVTSDITLLLNGEAGVAGGYDGKQMPCFRIIMPAVPVPFAAMTAIHLVRVIRRVQYWVVRVAYSVGRNCWHLSPGWARK